MSENGDYDYDHDGSGAAAPTPPKKEKKANKRLSVERIYQKKTQLEHILLRPDTYIGSAQPLTEKMWVFDEDTNQIVNREITYTPGLYKIFDEILVNAADNKQRDKKMDTIKIHIDADKNEIKIYNNGKGIPIVEHKDEKMFVPTMIFGHLLTSSNFNDEEEKVTGGRNGYGAKLCNVFSKKFVVETACKEYKKEFKQAWADNMSKASEAKLKEYGGEDFTRITFQPDLDKFNMTSLDKDTIALLSRRAYDVAASAPGVKVFLNNKRIAVKNFQDYVNLFLKGHEDETGNQIKCIYEKCSDRWEVAVAPSDNGFQQMSFVNSIATTKGGRHVDHVSKLIENALTDTLKKKNKGGIQIKPHQIRNHMWVFVNCLIVNPTFDSQTKENMTLQVNKFGSKCSFTDKFGKLLEKSGIVESVLAWSKFKADQQLKSKQSAKKTNKLRGIAKLEDANDAGTKNSMDCTLILTEGDSAKSLAVAGLGVIGRDKYGVYPLKGKLLNVREASHKQIMDNKEITDLCKILGLTYKKKYLSVEDLKSLRYGRLMIMTDQDQDGSHIKGLLINFIHHNWPDLLKLPFVEEFITPIVKATKGNNAISFFSLPEFYEWKNETDNWHTYKIKYYKGLGTSTSKEAKEYFSDMMRHRIKFRYKDAQDDHSINLAFSKKAIDQRKEWLTNWMEEGKRRKELGLPEVYLYEKDTRAVSYQDFINKELVLFSNLDNERSIPSVVDGFKPGQRKVIFTCLKRNDKREVKVAQLAGSIGEMSAYHHGEASLMGTIINLAQDFVGSNNVNLLQPIGQFGTRLAGGKDHASPRYIFTQMSPLTRLIFNSNDDPLLKYLNEDNQKIEPEWYVPILPMVLVNGADGIGTGWMTKIPNYDPREIVKNLKRMIRGEEPQPMKPFFKNFKGTIEELESHKYVVNGELSELSETKIEITELPVKTWTQSYKESVMEPLLNGSEKVPAQINEYKEYHTDRTVRFVINMAADKLRAADRTKGLHQFFKLQTTISTNSMVLFDHNGCLKRYDDVSEIMQEFFDLRLIYYDKRKKYLEGMLEAEALRLSNQARFILEKCDGSLVVENKKKKIMIDELQRRNFDPDPVKKWKTIQAKNEAAMLADSAAAALDDESDSDLEEDAKDADYDYLLGMAMWSLTQEKKDDLLKKKEAKHKELDELKRTSKEQLWQRDLDEFLEKLNEVEAKEREEAAAGVEAGGNRKKAGGKKKTLKEEAMPSPHGIRIAPRIPDEMRVKAAKATAAKDAKKGKNNLAKKLEKEIEDETDEFDMMINDKDKRRSLSDKLGFTPEKKPKAAAPKKAKKSDDGTPSKKGGKKKKNPWESSEDNDSDSDAEAASDDEMDVEKKVRDNVRRNAASTKYKDYMSSDSSDADDLFNSIKKRDESNGDMNGKHNSSGETKEADFDSLFEPSNAGAADETNGSAKKRSYDSSDEDDFKPSKIDVDEDDSPIKKPKATKRAKTMSSGDESADEFDAMLEKPEKKSQGCSQAQGCT